MIFKIIYNIGIHFYEFLIRLISPFNKKAALWFEGRKNIFEKIEASPIYNADGSKKVAWFHAASLGEFEQGRPVIEAFKKAYPDYKILLTFFSPSGYEIRKNYAEADYICYLPSDTPSNANTFINLVQPSIVFFIKYEFWANYLRALKARDIPSISFSTIFRPNQVFFKSYGEFFRETLFCFNHILVQNNESKELLNKIGYQAVTLAGDTRFDRVFEIASQKKQLPLVENFKNNQSIFIVGSAWQQDMEVLIPLINERQDLKFIIAPHEIHEDEISTWQKQFTGKSIRYSEAINGNNLAHYQILIINNIGLLSSLYQYANYAYIGGSFGKGLHNILEAATFGMPIFFGNKNYTKFQEAVELVALGGAFAIGSTAELKTKIDGISNAINPAEITENYVKQNIGATNKVLLIAKTLMK